MLDIAIVDDELPICNAVARALNEHGFQTRAFQDPLIALPHLICQPPRLLILNGNMPGMHGIEFFKRFRPYSRCPVVFLSASVDAIEETLLRQGCTAEAFISKPFSLSQLVSTCQQLIAVADHDSRRSNLDRQS